MWQRETGTQLLHTTPSSAGFTLPAALLTRLRPTCRAAAYIRPHTPLIVPQRFFDLFPLKEIDLPAIRPGDVEDTHARSIRGLPSGWRLNIFLSLPRPIYVNRFAHSADPNVDVGKHV